MMAGRGAGQPGAAGGPARHIPVLAPQVVNFLHPRDGGLIVDGTFGAGGYTRAILAAANCRVIGIDRDQSAIARGADLVEGAGGRLTLVGDRFSALATIVAATEVDGEGRVVLSDELKTHASIKDAATFVGLGHKFQIWEPQRFRAHLAQATATLRAARRSQEVGPNPQGARE